MTQGLTLRLRPFQPAAVRQDHIEKTLGRRPAIAVAEPSYAPGQMYFHQITEQDGHVQMASDILRVCIFSCP